MFEVFSVWFTVRICSISKGTAVMQLEKTLKCKLLLLECSAPWNYKFFLLFFLLWTWGLTSYHIQYLFFYIEKPKCFYYKNCQHEFAMAKALTFKIHYSKNFSHRLENCFYVFLIRLSNTICIEVDLWAKNFDTKLGLGWLNFWRKSLKAPSIFVLYETIDKIWFPNYLLLCACIIVVIFCCFVKTKLFFS